MSHLDSFPQVQNTTFDLKTIVSTGWHHSLVPDEYLLAAYFQAERDELEGLEAQVAEAQSELGEAVETAIEVAGYEPEENEKVTASVIKKALKDLIGDLKGSSSPSALRELGDLQAQERGILAIEQRIKDTKAKAKVKGDELALKLQLKRLGAAEFRAENEILLEQVLSQLVDLDPNDKTDKKKITALEKDRAVIQGRLAETDRLMAAIGGQLTEPEARQLILQKLYDIAQAELTRYLNAERRILLAALENLWDKYAVSSHQLEAQRSQTLMELNQFLVKLSYINEA